MSNLESADGVRGHNIFPHERYLNVTVPITIRCDRFPSSTFASANNSSPDTDIKFILTRPRSTRLVIITTIDTRCSQTIRQKPSNVGGSGPWRFHISISPVIFVITTCHRFKNTGLNRATRLSTHQDDVKISVLFRPEYLVLFHFHFRDYVDFVYVENLLERIYYYYFFFFFFFIQDGRDSGVTGFILRYFLSFVNTTTVHEPAERSQWLLTREYIQVSVLGLILSELGILHGARHVLNELLNSYGGPLAVLLAVLPFLKSGNVPWRIIQVVVGSVEAFPKDRSAQRETMLRHLSKKTQVHRHPEGLVQYPFLQARKNRDEVQNTPTRTAHALSLLARESLTRRVASRCAARFRSAPRREWLR
ncbi:hypothetical protein PUN28_010738 [Cardiocondyla obscurior]|uniref:Uncharacterized protein n=1 Tax=Cardiocondyla obscurior TaxID=286306 RepID=A0AAW2FND9_9HYME